MSKVADYFKENADALKEETINIFENTKDIARKEFLKVIRSFAQGDPMHYRLQGTKQSGTLIEDGTIDMNITVNQFLENEFPGDLDCRTFGDMFAEEAYSIAYSIQFNFLKKMVEEKVESDLTEADEGEIRNFIRGAIRDTLDWKKAVDYTDIGPMKLTEVVG